MTVQYCSSSRTKHIKRAHQHPSNPPAPAFTGAATSANRELLPRGLSEGAPTQDLNQPYWLTKHVQLSEAAKRCHETVSVIHPTKLAQQGLVYIPHQ